MRFEIFATIGVYSTWPTAEHNAEYLRIPAKYNFRVLLIPRVIWDAEFNITVLFFEERAFIDVETPEDMAELSRAIVRKLIIDNAPKGPEIEIYNDLRENRIFSGRYGHEWKISEAE